MDASNASIAKLKFTVSEFIDYFEKNDQLTLEAGKECVITDIKAALPGYTPGHPGETHPSKIIDIFNMILMPLAKCAIINGPKETQGSFNWDADVSWSFTHHVVITTKKDLIIGSIDDLFSIMMASSRLKLTLAPLQKLALTGFSHRELDTIKTPQNMINLFQTRTPYVLKLNIAGRYSLAKTTLTNGNGNRDGFTIMGMDNEAELVLEKRTEPPQKRHWTLMEFIEYFETYDVLALHSDQEFVIQGASQAYSKEPDSSFLTDDPFRRYIYLLNKLLIPLAKTAMIRLLEDGSGTCNCSNDLRICNSAPLLIRTSKTDLSTRITDLYACMMATSRLKIEIDPARELRLFGFRKREVEKMRSFEGMVNLFAKYCPPGFCVHFSAPGDTTAGGPRQTPNGVHFIRIISDTDMTLSLVEDTGYDGLHNLIKDLEARGKIVIPPGKGLIIRDIKLPLLLADYKRHFEQTMPFILYILRSISMLFSDKNICIRHDSSLSWSVHDDHYLVVKSDEKFEISFMDRKEAGVDIFTTMAFLGDLLILNSRRTFTLPPNQKLFIYGLDERAIRSFKMAILENDVSKVYTALISFIQDNNPLGYLWSIDPFTGHSAAGLLPIRNNEGILMLAIQCDVPMTFRLHRAGGEQLIINLLNHASLETLTAFQDGDAPAYTFLLFQALYFYCCEDPNISNFADHLPFKEVTREAIVKLLKDNEEFTEALEEVYRNDELYAECKEHLAKTPGEFALIIQNNLPPQLKVVFKEINELVYNELYGSPFINQCLGRVQHLLDEKIAIKQGLDS